MRAAAGSERSRDVCDEVEVLCGREGTSEGADAIVLFWVVLDGDGWWFGWLLRS